MSQVTRFYNVSAIFIAFILFSASAAFSGETLKWYSYDEAMALNKSMNKKVYINFYTDWCGYCRKMEKKTFTDDKVIAYLNSNYLPVRVNADKERKVAMQYRAFQFPDNTFITEKGEFIGKQPGYLGPEDFLKVITFVYEDKYKSNKK